jgi:hypothetical protein
VNFQSRLAAVGCGFFATSGPTGSQLIFNVKTNKFVAVIPNVQGVDIVATTPGGLFLYPSYISNIMYVVNLGPNGKARILQQIGTSDLAHTVTYNPESGRVFVPTGGGVVAVYSTKG